MHQIYPLIFNEDTIKRAFEKYLDQIKMIKVKLHPEYLRVEWEEFLKLLKESRE